MAATVRLTQRWSDGSATEVSIRVDSSYPDAVAEAKAQAIACWREVIAEDVPTPEVEGE